jgi:hypothetical protein
MRKEIGEAVRKRFNARMKEALPQFRELKSAGLTGIASGSRVYCCQAAPELSFFLILVPSVMDLDRFTLEGAWSKDGRVPSRLGFLTDQPDGSLRFRIPSLWEVPHGDYWWELTETRSTNAMTSEEFEDWLRNQEQVLKERIEEGLRRIPGCVDEAIERIVKYALPYFDGVAKAQGYLSPFLD